MNTDRHLNGLGGWLVLVAIGIILSPLRILTQVFPVYLDMFLNGSWGVLTTPGSQAYNPLLIPILIGEMLTNVGLILGCIFLAILFFSKKKLFPKFYISMLIFTLVFILIDTLAIKAVLPEEPIFDPDTLSSIIRTVMAIGIWVPYMLVSKRVKATFVR